MRILEFRGGGFACAAAIALLAGSALPAGAATAATPNATSPAAPAPSRPASGAPAPATQQGGQQLRYMQLQAQYKGPLADTVIERWRDPIDGTICYIYLPIVVQHSAPTNTGMVQYGGNNIGSISCLAAKF
jgi:hypothetical protein